MSMNAHAMVYICVAGSKGDRRRASRMMVSTMGSLMAAQGKFKSIVKEGTMGRTAEEGRRDGEQG